MPNIVIDQEILKAIAPFMSKEATRHHIRGVYFDGAGLVVATDGHKLAALKPTREITVVEPFALRSNTVKTLLGIKPMNKKLPVLFGIDLDAGVISAYQQQKDLLGTIPFKPVDGAFPDWRRVIPDATNYGAASVQEFNAKVLASVESLGDSVRVYCNSTPNSPALIRAKTPLYDAVSVLMPHRMTTEEEMLPAWAGR